MDVAGPDAVGLWHGDVLLEWYRYPPGPAVVLDGHAHDEYQLNLNLDLPGGYEYRGGYHVVPARRLTVVMPGEVHRPRDCAAREVDSAHLTLYVRPETMAEVAGEMGTRFVGLPAFDLVIEDEAVVGTFAGLHAALAGPDSVLARDIRLVGFLDSLVTRHAGIGVATVPAAHRAVRRAREYLHEHWAREVSLAELASVAGLSPYRLVRLFSANVGLPPHAYQVQLRIAKAKRLLLAGRSVSDTGHEVGFYDLSHFSRHFKRHVGVPPGAYQRQVRTS